MIRLFNVYYSLRTLILVLGEALLIWTSLFLSVALGPRGNPYFFHNLEYGYYTIIFAATIVTILVLLIFHWLDLYNPVTSAGKREFYSRLLLIPGVLALGLAGAETTFPRLMVNNFPFIPGLCAITVALLGWRSAYLWLARKRYFRERVYVLGSGERAKRLVRGLQERWELGVDVVGWSGEMEGVPTREKIDSHLCETAKLHALHRVIVAMEDRRDTMPMERLLDLRLEGAVHIEEATSYLEKIYGKIELENLDRSWIIYSHGFHLHDAFRLVRPILNFVVGSTGLILSAPLVPLIALAIRLESPGPVLYHQKRVGRRGDHFTCYKFRTMCQDAEADVGPTWADDDDPRITRVGRFLRISRLDEIPQLWCVMWGDMAFVGPRPERPEFVESLKKKIKYYDLRHLVRPGITGWAQINYKYGNSDEDAREKLQYDLFYIKNASIGLDLLIIFQTIKTVLHLRGV